MIKEVEGASIMCLVTPPAQLMDLSYDYSGGIPKVKLRPIVQFRCWKMSSYLAWFVSFHDWALGTHFAFCFYSGESGK